MQTPSVFSSPFIGRTFFFNDTATTETYTLSLHDALPIRRHRHSARVHHHKIRGFTQQGRDLVTLSGVRSEEHTSELQSRLHLVCRLLLEKKKKRRILNRIDNLERKQTAKR